MKYYEVSTKLYFVCILSVREIKNTEGTFLRDDIEKNFHKHC